MPKAVNQMEMGWVFQVQGATTVKALCFQVQGATAVKALFQVVTHTLLIRDGNTQSWGSIHVGAGSALGTLVPDLLRFVGGAVFFFHHRCPITSSCNLDSQNDLKQTPLSLCSPSATKILAYLTEL